MSDVLLRAALGHDNPATVVFADAAGLPLRGGCADLVVASMLLMDVEDLRGAVAEAARVLRHGGHFYFFISLCSTPCTLPVRSRSGGT